jgi:dolichol-phosphate mannosyltransferase
MSTRLGRFLAVGGIGAAVNLGALTLLLAAGVDKYIASPLAIEVSILSNFVLHESWTFADRRAGTWGTRLWRFHSVALLALAASYATFVALSALVPGIVPQTAQAVAILPGTAVNWLCNTRWTFREARPDGAAARP